MLDLHEDVSLFHEAVRFTQARTGFAARLIEKDYFCTVLLTYLAESDPMRASTSNRSRCGLLMLCPS